MIWGILVWWVHSKYIDNIYKHLSKLFICLLKFNIIKGIWSQKIFEVNVAYQIFPSELLPRHYDKKQYYKKKLRDGELNPGLPRDRRGYSPLYYLGYNLHWNSFFFTTIDRYRCYNNKTCIFLTMNNLWIKEVTYSLLYNVIFRFLHLFQKVL